MQTPSPGRRGATGTTQPRPSSRPVQSSGWASPENWVDLARLSYGDVIQHGGLALSGARRVVHAAGREGRAAQDPPPGHRRPPDRPSVADRDLRISRAARVEPALPPEQGAEGNPVP